MLNLSMLRKHKRWSVLSFSRTFAVYDYLFINNTPIEHVASFKYIDTLKSRL